jgi:hypothetical protein
MVRLLRPRRRVANPTIRTLFITSKSTIYFRLREEEGEKSGMKFHSNI